MDDAQTVGTRIRELRNALGYPSAADFCRAVGMTPQALSNWENGFKRIGHYEASKIRAVTGASLDYIFFGDEWLLPPLVRERLQAYRKQQRPKNEALPSFRLSA
jgi:transcriptional regulator with XRE-family HTH domain